MRTAIRSSKPSKSLRSLIVTLLFSSVALYAATAGADVASTGSFVGQYEVTFKSGTTVTDTLSDFDLPLNELLTDYDFGDGNPAENEVIFGANIFEEIPGTGDPEFNFTTSLAGLGSVAASGTTTIQQVFTNTSADRERLHTEPARTSAGQPQYLTR